MVAIVSGFPSNFAALQFEWAWQNTHLTKRIPPELRITSIPSQRTKTSKSGKVRKRPGRPRTSLVDKLSNLHLLLRVDSFSRWPLEVRFFAEDVYKVWQRWVERDGGKLREGIPVTLDTGTEIKGLEPVMEEGEQDIIPPSGQEQIVQKRKLKLDDVGSLGLRSLIPSFGYGGHKDHVEKSLAMLDDIEGAPCAVCSGVIRAKDEHVATCPGEGCMATSHLSCLSSHFLKSEESRRGNEESQLIPTEGNCPSCKSELRWVDIMKELSLRTYGAKEIAKLTKVKKAKKVKAVGGKGKGKSSQSIIESSDLELDEEDEELDDHLTGMDDEGFSAEDLAEVDVDSFSDEDVSDLESVLSVRSRVSSKSPRKGRALSSVETLTPVKRRPGRPKNVKPAVVKPKLGRPKGSKNMSKSATIEISDSESNATVILD
jgi:structure-specific endonuclease subunit SLX1